MARRRAAPGAVVRVPLGEGRFGFGRCLKVPLVEFFDVVRQGEDGPPDLAELASSPVAFRVSVMDAAVKHWPTVAELALSDDELDAVYRFFRQDTISGALTVAWTDLAGAYGEAPATWEECQGLEADAVWSAHHVEARLRDHVDGVVNEVAERFKPRDPAEWRPHATFED